MNTDQVNEIAPALAALAGELTGGAVAAGAGEGLAGRLAASLAANKVKDTLSDREDKCDSCENCEECGCDKCKKDVRIPLKIGVRENKYTDMVERVNIVKFLKTLNEKNYAEAHKYLKKIMESKLQKRIAKYKSVKVF